jgi:hypothetical protein
MPRLSNDLTPPAGPDALPGEEFAPVFVLATARSYSSVFSAMVGQHPDLYGFPELKLFAWEHADPRRAPGLVRATAEVLFDGQIPECLAAARAWLDERQTWPGRDLFDELQRRIAPRRAVEKSPEHALTDAALQRICAAYPRVQFIHLVRHPVTAAASMRRHMRLTDADATAFCLYAWYETNFRLSEFGARVGVGRCLLIRGEAALDDPRAELARMASWLGLQADECAVERMLHPERSPFAHSLCDASLGNDRDPGFLQSPHLRPVPASPPLVPPPDWSGPDRLWSSIVELAASFGYSVSARSD